MLFLGVSGAQLPPSRTVAARFQSAPKDQIMARGSFSHSKLDLLVLKGRMPDFRHKVRNAGQVFATNRETKISAAKYG
jgi:hypothetical protein